MYSRINELESIEDISSVLQIEPDVYSDPVTAAWVVQSHNGGKPLTPDTTVYRYTYFGLPHRHIIVFVSNISSNITGITWMGM